MSAPYRPDFVILGMPTVGGVMVIASAQLSEADLTSEHIAPGAHEYVLHTRMQGYSVAIADDYAAALRYLFAAWQPSGAGTLAGWVALEPGDG